jgi:ABC-type spermidine/putrescine transport system permease subunit I
MNARWTPYLLSAPAVAMLVGLLAFPLLLLARVSLCEPAHGRGFFTPGTWTVVIYAVVMNGYHLSILGFTVLFGAAVATLTVAVAYPLALFVRSLRPSMRRVALACVLLPKLASVLVILFGLQQMLGDAGLVNRALVTMGIVPEPIRLVRNGFGATIAETVLIVPYAVLVLVTQMRGIDPDLEAAARGLGASRWQTFCRVTFRLSLPGVILAGQLGLVWGMGAFLGPLLLGSPDETTFSIEVHRQAFEYGRWPRAATLAILLIATVGFSLLLYALATRLARKSQ